jgi:hypothetical protein
MAQFLGAGAAPAVFGALLTTRQHNGASALNPLHADQVTAAFSDVFLIMAVVIVPALIAAYRMRPTPSSSTGSAVG